MPSRNPTKCQAMTTTADKLSHRDVPLHASSECDWSTYCGLYVGHIHSVILCAIRQLRNKLHPFVHTIVHGCPVKTVLHISLVLIYSDNINTQYIFQQSLLTWSWVSSRLNGLPSPFFIICASYWNKSQLFLSSTTTYHQAYTNKWMNK